MKACEKCNLTCPYARLGNTCTECIYDNYCDFQLPRDSRTFLEFKHKEEKFNDYDVYSVPCNDKPIIGDEIPPKYIVTC